MQEDLRTKLWVSLFALMVFLMGLGVGVFLDARSAGSFRLSLRGPESVRDRPPGRLPLRAPEFVRGRSAGRPNIRHENRDPSQRLRRLKTTLELSEEQTKKLEVLFQTQREEIEEIGRHVRQQLGARKETFQTSVAEILTSTQMELFKKRFSGKRGRTRVIRKSHRG